MGYNFFSKLVALAEVPYPITVVMMVIPFLLGVIFSLGGFPSFYFILLCFILMFSYIGFFNTINAIADLESDLISKPHRPLPSKRLSIFEAKIFSIFLLIVFVGCSFFIFQLDIFFLTVIFCILAYLYSNILKFKRIPFFANLFLGVVYTFFPLFLGWSLSNGNAFIPWIDFLLIFLFTTIVLFCKDFEDYVADKKHHVKTFVNLFGFEKALGIVLGTFLSFFIFLLIMVGSGVLSPNYLILLLLAPFIFLTLKYFYQDLAVYRAFIFFKLLTAQVIVFQVIVTLINVL